MTIRNNEVLYFDVECFFNFFICAVKLVQLDGKETEHCFEIGDRARASKAFRRKGAVYVGHNTLSYDNIMVAYWLDTNANETQLRALNDFLIEGRKVEDKRTSWWIKENVNLSEWVKFGQVRRRHQLRWEVTERLGWKGRLDVDTLILGEGQGSLKNAAINLGISNLMEAPVAFDQILTESEKNLVRKYCFNDVRVTEKLYAWYSEIIEIRGEFYDMGIKQAYTVGSAKLAELYLLKRLELEIGIIEFEKWKVKAYEDAKKHREFDPVVDLIGNYKFTFKDSGFARLWDRLKVCDLMYLDSITLKNYDVATGDEYDEDWKKKLFEPSAFRNLEGKQIPKGDLIVTDDRGMVYQFGVGGLHNVAPRGVWKETETMAIFNGDALSYYPSMIVKNGFSPRQFPRFSQLMDKLLEERKADKKAKRAKKEKSKKLVLNTSFGKTKDSKSILYDPKTTFSVTLCGQLLLLQLIDWIYQISPETTVINANTDGVCLYVPKAQLPAIYAIMNHWQKYSMMGLESEFYQVWAQATCNLYCALDESDKIKSKGSTFKLKPMAMRETATESPAVKKMLIECLLYHKHPDEVCKTLPLEDFTMSCNFGGKRTLIVDGAPQMGRRSLRYAWVKNGSVLQKLEARGLSIVGKNHKCQVLDSMSELESENIDRDFYVQEAMTKVLEIVGTHTTLNLPSKVLKEIRVNFDKWFL